MVVRTATSFSRRKAQTGKTELTAGSAEQASHCRTPVSRVRRRRTHALCDSHLQIVEPRQPKGPKPFSADYDDLEVCPPRHSQIVFLVFRNTLVGRKVCYEDSLPLPYFTQTAYPDNRHSPDCVLYCVGRLAIVPRDRKSVV